MNGVFLGTDPKIRPGRHGALESLDFLLPPNLEANQPPEARGLSRDQVRLMVSYLSEDKVVHTQFRRLTDHLRPGDLLVINTSGTMKASLDAVRADGSPLEFHLSTHLPADLWSIELRQPTPDGSLPFYAASSGETLSLPGGGKAALLAPLSHETEMQQPVHPKRGRLWVASLDLPIPIHKYLDRYGSPIRYKYVREEWPVSYYQNVYATEIGSAEMPSAGRAFTPELITQLIARGIQIAPLLLHTGVASLEEDERPYEEYYRVPAPTASLVNAARQAHNRVIAVGTTVVRALETVAENDGSVHAGEGWTNLVVTPGTRLRAVDGLLTGLHEPRSTHLSMLLAFAPSGHLQKAYSEALERGYLWHEFGDLHLLLP
jgi:S-adenosylmethionine:tRNA ribosyltransferase-isomerase